MKRIAALLLALLLLLPLTAAAEGILASPNQKIATRTGPSTQYEGSDTFLINSWRTQQVKVFSKAWDNGNDIWWLQIELTENGRKYRLYTGLKRVNVDIGLVPEERLLGTGSMSAAGDVTAYFGPGKEYAVMKNDVPWSVDVTVWGAENGYLLVDFYDMAMQKQRRAWVYADLADIHWVNGAPSGSIPDNQASIPAGTVYRLPGRMDTRCTVLQYAQKGGFTIVDLQLYGNNDYALLPIRMEGSDYGTFSTGAGGGDVWFYTDQIVIDAYMPSLGVTQTLVLQKSTY